MLLFRCKNEKQIWDNYWKTLPPCERCRLNHLIFNAFEKACVPLNPLHLSPCRQRQRNKSDLKLCCDKFAAASQVSNQFVSSPGFTNSMSVSLKNIVLTEVKQCRCEGTNDTSLIIVDTQQQHLGRHIQGKMGLFFFFFLNKGFEKVAYV